MKHRYLTFFLLFPFFCSGQVVDSTAFAHLTHAILQFQTSDLLQHGMLGVSLSNRNSGESLLTLNADKSLPPASTLKLVTTATALEVLGEDFTFETYLEYEGTISNGTLKGNLFIRGTGDPTLGSPRFKDRTDSATVFNAWLAALRNAGIHRIQGKVIADPNHFDELSLEDSWLWGDVSNAYGAGIRGLNWNENMCRIYFKTGTKVGDPTKIVRIEPHHPVVKYTNLVTTGPVGSGDKTLIRPAESLTHLIIDGTVPRVRNEYNIKGALPNPPLFLASQFSAFLENQNVNVKEAPEMKPPGAPAGERRRIYTWKSPPLAELCKQTNWWSLNLYAEAMVKTVGKKLIGKTEFKLIAPAIASFWSLKGVNISGMVLKDGSGLAGTALLTPQNLTDILNKASQLPSFSSFFETIPVAGEAGTVRNRRFGSNTSVRAKSGSIEGTRAYAGYITSQSGTPLSFVINAHRYHFDSAREVSQKLMEIVKLMGEL